MSFWLRTKNIKNDVRKKNPISWLDWDVEQLFMYIITWIILFSVIIIANIWIIWKVLISLLVISITISWSAKYDDSSINAIHSDYWRVKFEWFRIYIRKLMSWNKSVDKWVDYNYFKKK